MIVLVISFVAVLQVVCNANEIYHKFHSDVSFDTISGSAGSSTRTLDCATVCLESSRCHGFLFNIAESSSCSFIQCVNPNLFNVSSTGAQKVYLKNPLTANHLLARGKNATMISVRTIGVGCFEAGCAVDGVYLPPADNELLSVTHTNNEVQPWWRVDLADVYCVWAVNILNRGSQITGLSVSNRARNAIITVSESEGNIFYTGDNNVLCSYYADILNQFYTLITCAQPIIGQFVQIQLNTTNMLHFYEVEVHGI